MIDQAPAPRAKKSLGQHFLRDRSICERIVGLLQCGPDDRILEIGPGPGALTKILENIPRAGLLALEKDAFWARERNNANCQAILMDALRFDWTRLCGKWKIIGNLPYNVASPLIWDLVAQIPRGARAVFMVQKEVARRIAARPGSREYGALSVWIQYHAIPRLAFNVGPGAFRPPPKVDSTVFSLEFPPLEKEANPAHLAALLKICFQNRRKQLGTIFRKANLPENLLEGYDKMLRPENLCVDDFALIAERGQELLAARQIAKAE